MGFPIFGLLLYHNLLFTGYFTNSPNIDIDRDPTQKYVMVGEGRVFRVRAEFSSCWTCLHG